MATAGLGYGLVMPSYASGSIVPEINLLVATYGINRYQIGLSGRAQDGRDPGFHDTEGSMSAIGGFLLMIGLVSIGLYMIDYKLMVLSWIDNWGTTVGWAIRVALVMAGGVLIGVARLSADSEPSEH